MEVKTSKSHLPCWETLYEYQEFHGITNFHAFFMKSECPGLDRWKLRQQLFWGQLPVSCLVAGQVLRQHLCKFSAFARIWSGFTWWLVTLLPPPLLFPSVPPPPTHLFLHSRCIPPVIMGDRHSSSAGTPDQVDQVSHLSGGCAACAYLWLSAARMEDSSAKQRAAMLGSLWDTCWLIVRKEKLLMRDVR